MHHSYPLGWPASLVSVPRCWRTVSHGESDVAVSANVPLPVFVTSIEAGAGFTPLD
jgi:hypothetical protein